MNELKNKKGFNAALFFTLLFFVSSCSNTNNHESGEIGGAKVQTVQVVRPEMRMIVPNIEISGNAKANEVVNVFAMESGYVKKVFKDIGDKVGMGEVLVQLENPEIEQALQKAQVKFNSAKATYERLESSYEKSPSITPLQVLDEAKAEYLSAQADLVALTARKEYLKVKAPFTGTITQRSIDRGALVQSGIQNSSGQALFEIQDTKTIRLGLDLPESDIEKVKKGMKVLVNFPELDHDPFEARISRMSNALDPESKTMTVEVDIPNKLNTIKVGMYAEVELLLEEREKVLSVQVAAQIIVQKEPYILVVRNGIIENIPLQRGFSNKNYFEILNKDVNPEDLIVLRGKNLVQAGQKVKAVITKAE